MNTKAVHYIGMCAGVLLLVSRATPAPAATENQIPVVNPFFMLSSALLTDSFDGSQLDTNLWSRPPWLVNNHKTIGVKIENGHLVISRPSHPEKQNHQYAGILSKYFRDTDVVLAAEVQAQSPFKAGGRIQHMVHLCSGDYPDFFTEKHSEHTDADGRGQREAVSQPGAQRRSQYGTARHRLCRPGSHTAELAGSTRATCGRWT